MYRTPSYLRLLIVVFSYILLNTSALSAQTLVKHPAKITNSGDLLSSVKIEENASDFAALKKQVPANMVETILANCSESSWVEGMATLDARNKNRPMIADYVVYEIANLNGQHLLLVPASENQGMRKEMRPNRDFYMLIGASGVEVKGAVSAEKEDIAQENVEEGLPRAYIKNVMDLYSTFDLEVNEEAKEMFIPQIGEEAFKQLAYLANDASWPEGINSFTTRETNRSKFKDYHLFYIADFGKHTLVYAPESENQHMPENMRPLTEEGIFFVFKSGAISIENEELEVAPSNAYTAGDFGSELNALMLALKGNFASIKGELIPEKEDGLAILMGKKYASTINLTSSQSVTILENSFGSSVSMVADYGNFRDSVQAEKIYKDLVAKVSKVHFAVGTMVQSEQNLDNLMVTYWLPFDMSGKMDKAYSKIVLEIQLLKTLGFDKDFNTYRESSISLRVYKQNN